MNMTEEARLSGASATAEINLSTPMDRRGDVDTKQSRIAELLNEVGCDGLLILQPENFSWLTSGGSSRIVLDPESQPALYVTADARWVLSCNADSQRLFDEELDGLGFQLKEWPWHWGRTQLLNDLCQGRNVACDTPFATCKLVAPQVQLLRRSLTHHEIACYAVLGQILSHALEATGRTLTIGETEREIAGQLSHRLLHRGTHPLLISVAADSRNRIYRQPAFTSAPIQRSCVMTVAARKYGLCARASRTVSFGQSDVGFRRDHDSACKISATYVAGSWPDSVPRQILLTGQRIYQLTGVEHEFFLAPQGHLTGRAPVELNFMPAHEDLLQANWALTWCVSVGSAISCDTFIITEEGPRPITAPENWPLKRIRIQGAEFVRPDILVR